MSAREHLSAFATAGAARLLPTESRQLAVQGSIDSYDYILRLPPPPPCRSPPLVVPRRGGGRLSLGQPKSFRCASLCCCGGDCVVGHCHLYPLHSWQDILLTFAKTELDSTTMFTPGTSVMFIRSTGEPVWRRSLDIRSTVMRIAASLMTVMARPSCTTVRPFGTSHCHVLPLPKICLRLPSLLPRRQNHHPRVLPKAFQWNVESMCKSSR